MRLSAYGRDGFSNLFLTINHCFRSTVIQKFMLWLSCEEWWRSVLFFLLLVRTEDIDSSTVVELIHLRHYHCVWFFKCQQSGSHSLALCRLTEMDYLPKDLSWRSSEEIVLYMGERMRESKWVEYHFKCCSCSWTFFRVSSSVNGSWWISLRVCCSVTGGVSGAWGGGADVQEGSRGGDAADTAGAATV